MVMADIAPMGVISAKRGAYFVQTPRRITNSPALPAAIEVSSSVRSIMVQSLSRGAKVKCCPPIAACAMNPCNGST